MTAGELLGSVYSLDKAHEPLVEIRAQAAMTVMGVRTIVPVTPGDALFWAGAEVTAADLLANNF